MVNTEWNEWNHFSMSEQNRNVFMDLFEYSKGKVFCVSRDKGQSNSDKNHEDFHLQPTFSFDPYLYWGALLVYHDDQVRRGSQSSDNNQENIYLTFMVFMFIESKLSDLDTLVKQTLLRHKVEKWKWKKKPTKASPRDTGLRPDRLLHH